MITKKGFEIRLPDWFFFYDRHNYYAKCKKGCFNMEAFFLHDYNKWKTIIPKKCPFCNDKIVKGVYTSSGGGIGLFLLVIVLVVILIALGVI